MDHGTGRVDHDADGKAHGTGGMDHDAGRTAHRVGRLDYDTGGSAHRAGRVDYEAGGNAHGTGRVDHDAGGKAHRTGPVDHDAGGMDHGTGRMDHNASGKAHHAAGMGHDAGRMEHNSGGKEHNTGRDDSPERAGFPARRSIADAGQGRRGVHSVAHPPGRLPRGDAAWPNRPLGVTRNRMSPADPHDLPSLVVLMSERIAAARQRSLTAVSREMVQLYWELGRHIVEFEQGGEERARYGEALIPALAAELTRAHGNGFSVRNLANFRAFYRAFPNSAGAPAELGNAR